MMAILLFRRRNINIQQWGGGFHFLSIRILLNMQVPGAWNAVELSRKGSKPLCPTNGREDGGELGLSMT